MDVTKLSQSTLFTLKSYVINTIDKVWRSEPAICKNIKVWSHNQPETTVQVLHENILESQLIERSLPNTIEPDIHPIFLKRSTNVSPEKYLVCLSNAQLIGHNGVLILPDGSYAVEPVMNQWYLTHLPEYYSQLRRCFYKTQRKEGTYYLILQLYAATGNYYHWIHDILQKFYLILERLPKDITFIVPHHLKEWQYEALDAIGIPRDRLLPYSGREVWELESLYFSPLTALNDYDTPGANEWVQNQFYQAYHVDVSSSDQTEFVYVSRSLAPGRRIINEAEVQDVLQSYGFKTYFLEKMTLREQVQLFARAKTVVAPHGAGLTNLMFSQPGTRVLEIFEPSTIPSFFWSLSNAMHLPYWYCFGETIQNSRKSIQPDIFLPVEKLTKALQHLFA